MNTLSTVLVLVLAFAAGNAQAFRDDFPADPQRDCVPSATSVSPGYRDYCALAAIERACSTHSPQLAEDVAHVLGVDVSRVVKAIGRQTVVSLEHGDICARGEAERRQVLTASLRARKVKAESSQEWLLKQLGGPSGVIDHAAVARALEQRAKILTEARAKRAGEARAKRAGLPATPGGWTNLTGYTQSAGRINHILFTSATGNDILAGADGGGIWRSSNGGTLWTPVNDFLGSLSITNFAANGTTIYAGTNTRGSHTYFPFGIVKSVDGGATWNQIAATNPSTNADFEYVQRVAVSPADPTFVLAATEGGAYQSADGGTSWTKLPGPAATPFNGGRAYYAAIHPTNASYQAVAFDDGTVRYTTTGNLPTGATVSTVLGGSGSGHYTKIAYAKSDVTRMYALVTDTATFNTRLFMSTNSGGAPWVEISTAGAGFNGTFYNSGYLSYTGGIWVDPVNANRVAVFEGWAAFTADITAVTPTWRRLASGWTDYHGIVEHPGYNGGGNRTVFFMDDGGLYRTTDIDNLDTFPAFTRLDTGMTVTQVYSVSGHGGNIILGAQDVSARVYRTDIPGGDSTNKWRYLHLPPTHPTCPNCQLNGDGAATAASTVNSSVLYGSTQYLNLFRSSDAGITATPIAGTTLTEGQGATPSNTNARFIAPFVLDPSNQSRMLAAGRSLWQSTNVDTGNPPTWTAIRGPYTDPNCGIVTISAIAIAPTNPDVVWIAYDCGGHVFKTSNGTNPAPTWTEVTTNLPSVAGLFRTKVAITIDAVNPNVVWLGVAQYQTNTLFKTTDGGATPGNWTTIPGLPGAPVYSLRQHPSNGSSLYAATGVGLFASADAGATWSTSNEGPANTVVWSLAWNTTGPSAELLVGTFGRGVFKATVSSVLTSTTTTLVSSPTSSAAAGTSVTFTATVSGSSPTPTGSVNFRDGVTDLGTVPLNGSAQAALVTSSLAAGSHLITAAYQGDSTYANSLSSTLSFTITSPNPPRLANISTRGQVQTGFNVMIGGFVISGSTPKTVVVRAIGPSLANFGVAGALPNPTLQLVRSSDQSVIATNDDWGSASNAAQITSSGFAPSNPLESAILTTLQPGAYTAIVSGVGGGTGVGLVEVYEVDHPEIALINISTRGKVQTGFDVMIGGFVVQGSGPQTVVIRAIGPSLANFGVSGALANPTMSLVRMSDNATIATNDDWGSASNAAQITSSGFAPSNSLESAILITLQPGAYTAVVSGVGGGTGVGLVEVYTLP